MNEPSQHSHALKVISIHSSKVVFKIQREKTSTKSDVKRSRFPAY